MQSLSRRALRRAQAHAHMWRRLKEDRNQHYSNVNCACYTDRKVMARFKEQPKLCSLSCCGNPRRWADSADGRLTMQERRAVDAARADA